MPDVGGDPGGGRPLTIVGDVDDLGLRVPAEEVDDDMRVRSDEEPAPLPLRNVPEVQE